MYRFGFESKEQIYKYFPLKYLLDMLQKQSMCVGRVSSWEDVYENFFLKQQFVYEGNIIPSECLNQYFSGFFGQSWTSCRSSDAMWRIYSNAVNKEHCLWKSLQETAVRISTTPRMLYDALSSSQESAGLGFEMHEVKYVKQDEMEQWLADIQPIKQTNMAELIIESLFMKREDFQHEQEVRLFVHVESNREDRNVSMLRFQINPQHILTEYVLDPRLDNQQCECIKGMIASCGVDERLIRQSKLYMLNKKKIKVES